MSKKEKQEEDESWSDDSENAIILPEHREWPNGTPLQTEFAPIEMFQAIEENIPKHPAILAAGKRRTGKSTTFDNLLEKCMRHIPFGIVMSETLMNGFWQTRVPPRNCFQGWREDILIALVTRQKRMIAKYGKPDPRTFAFIILDDVIADQKAIRWSKTINSFFTEGRHLNITVLITTQYMRGIGPMLRGNMDIVFLQPIYSILDRQVIHELYAGFMPKKDFFRLMDQVVAVEEAEGSTAQNPDMRVRVMVVEDWRQTPDITQKFKYWLPVASEKVPAYRLCDPIYWKEDAVEDIGAGHAQPMKRKDLVDTLDEVNAVLG